MSAVEKEINQNNESGRPMLRIVGKVPVEQLREADDGQVSPLIGEDGNRLHWDALYSAYTPAIITKYERMNLEDPEGAATDVFQGRIMERIDRFNPDAGNFSAWTMRVASNYGLDQLRAVRRRPQIPLEAAVYTAAKADQQNGGSVVENAVERSETIEEVQQALATLSSDSRKVLELYHIEGLAYNEIADTVGLPLGTVQSRINRARKKFQQVFREINPDY